MQNVADNAKNVAKESRFTAQPQKLIPSLTPGTGTLDLTPSLYYSTDKYRNHVWKWKNH